MTGGSNPPTPTPPVSDVNPHYLDHVVKLSESSDIEASEDIVTRSGMKLLAKGAKIDARARGRLLEFRLTKPLENMMRVVGGTDPGSFHEVAERLLAVNPLLRSICGHASGFRPANALKGLNLSPAVQSLLSVYVGRTPEKLDHAVGVALLAVALGAELSSDPADLATTVVAGLVHDVGELYIDPGFLARGARLTPQEWKHVATHPIVGAHVLGAMPGAGSRVAVAVMAHHERLDGSGYPQGTQAKGLSSVSQVLAAAEMLMGLTEAGAHTAERAEMALRLVPGEFGRHVVERVSSAVRGAVTDVAAAPAPNVLDDRIASLAASIKQAHLLRERIELELGEAGKPMHSLIRHAFERWERVRIAFSSTGLDSCTDDQLRPLIETMNPRERVEVEVVLRELQWRLADLERQLTLRSEQLGPDNARRVVDLIAGVRQPATMD